MIDYKTETVKIRETEEGIEFSRQFYWADLPGNELLRLIGGGRIDGIYKDGRSVYMVISHPMEESRRLVKITGTGSGQEIKIMSMTADGISCVADALARLNQEKNP